MGLFVGSDGGVGLALLRSKHLGTLKVGITSVEFVFAEHVKENIVQHSQVTTSLSASKLEFVFARAITSNATL